VLLIPGDRWQLPFFHGIRVCFFFFFAKVGMSFSLRMMFFVIISAALEFGLQK
jgi:hypothetical protein